MRFVHVQWKTKNARELEAQLTHYSLRVSSLDEYMAALSGYVRVSEELAKVNGSMKKKHAALTRAMNKQHALDGLVNMVAPDPDTVVLFGSGFFGGPARKGSSPKWSAAIRAFRRHLANTGLLDVQS